MNGQVAGRPVCARLVTKYPTQKTDPKKPTKKTLWKEQSKVGFLGFLKIKACYDLQNVLVSSKVTFMYLKNNNNNLNNLQICFKNEINKMHQLFGVLGW